MRSENEMYDLIINYGKQNELIRAIYMNGSRANPNIIKDKYQDYDIVFVVSDITPFIENKEWLRIFGDTLIYQEPDINDEKMNILSDTNRSYTRLMLFTDNNRIDLHIEEIYNIGYLNTLLTVPLFDKDGLFKEKFTPSDAEFYIDKPTQDLFDANVNEYWWCMNNVAKGIVRNEIPYTMWMFNDIVRKPLDKMIGWYIGYKKSFNINLGKHNKYYYKYLVKDLYQLYLQTYPLASVDDIWKAVDIANRLFHDLALYVSNKGKFIYHEEEEIGSKKYLSFMKNEKTLNKEVK